MNQIETFQEKYLQQRNGKFGVNKEGVIVYDIPNPTPCIEANSYYFAHPEWAKNYFECCHRDDNFNSRWLTAVETLDNKVVVDIGCGPGNFFANLGGSPKILIGVDVSLGALKMAQKLGYTPVLADAHDLPLVSQCADIVVLNATIHHCDDMTKVLQEAARLVRPQGLLITDHDPQKTAWNYQGVAKQLWNLRLPLYRFIKRGGHGTMEEQKWSLATEAHHKPGDGVSSSLFRQVLEPLGFKITLCPHNHTVGSEVFNGNYGQAAFKYRIAQRLSGINPDSAEAALSLMCIAERL